MTMRKLVCALLLLLLVLMGCGGEPPAASAPPTTAPAESPADAFAARVERAHARDGWLAHEALAAEIEVTFQSSKLLEGQITFRTDMSRSRVDTAAGPSVVWDGRTAWVSPADAELPMARFHVLTWPYFALAPIKLRDPGAHLEPLGELTSQGRRFDAARLSFGDGVGDTPDDWYVVYCSPDDSRVDSMGYIVTYGITAEKAEQEPHAIRYGDYVELNGVPVPTRWTFFMWNEQEGIHGDPIGSVVLGKPAFVEPETGFFDPPESAREAPLPQPPRE
jgi:hypothetical protein